VDKFDISKITTYQAGIAQASVHRSLQKLCDNILLPFGISKMQWMIIGAVSDAGAKGARISDLAKQLGTTVPYLTTSINLLESKGYLVRNANTADSRSKLVTINTKKLADLDTIEATLRDGLRKSIYADIEPEQFRTYLKVMYQLSGVDKNQK